MAQPTVEPAAPPARERPALAGVVGLGVALAVGVAAGLTVLTGARPIAPLGLPDPGALTVIGLPAARALADVGAVLTIGALLFAAFLVPPQRSGYLDVAGYRALRAASWSAAGWALAAFLLVPLNVADALGRPLPDVLDVGLLVDVVPRLSAATAWTVTALIALVVMVGCRTALTWGWTTGVFGLAAIGLLPVALTGHSAGGGAHDVATDSLVLHVLAASFWVGGLVAVIGLAVSRGPDRSRALAVAVPRFSRMAMACWIVLAVTGVVNATVRLPVGELFGSDYGRLVLAKAAALVALGALGAAHRRHSVDQAARGEPGALLRLGGVEVLVMLGTIGLAVALGRTATPDAGAGVPSRLKALIGYDLAGPPTLLRLAVDWRFDLVFGTVALVAAAVYLGGVRRMRQRGDHWPVGRTFAWLGGCAALLVATSSGIGRYGPAMFSVHMAEHMILGMLVPILLVLGAPVTLALRTLPAAGRDGPPGPREWLLTAVHSPVARWLTHPLISLPLFVGTYYALYFSELFPAALPEHGAHVLMNIHFIAVGVLFFWPIIGIDPAPRRLPAMARLGIIFLSVPFHAFFGVVLMGANEVIGGDFYRSLALPWVPDPLTDQKLGGGLAWAAGELPLLMVVIALLIQWSRQDERSARRDDRRADADGEADLTAYNAMLHRLATGTGPPVAQSDHFGDPLGHTGEVERTSERTTAGPAGYGVGSISAGHSDDGDVVTPPDGRAAGRPLVVGEDARDDRG